MRYLKRVYTRREDDVLVVNKIKFDSYVARLRRERKEKLAKPSNPNFPILPDEAFHMSWYFPAISRQEVFPFDHLLKILDQSVLPKPNELETTETSVPIHSFTDDIVLQHLQTPQDLAFKTEDGILHVSIENLRQNNLSIRLEESFLAQLDNTASFKQLFIQLIEASNPLVAFASFGQITEKEYKDYFLNTDLDDASVISWLEYYNQDKFKEGMGSSTTSHPDFDITPLADGYLLQIHESPYDIYTPEGTAKAVKATKTLPLWEISYHENNY